MSLFQRHCHGSQWPPRCPRALTTVKGRTDDPTCAHSQEWGAKIYSNTGDPPAISISPNACSDSFHSLLPQSKWSSLQPNWIIFGPSATACPSQTGRGVATPNVPNREEKQNKCLDSPWITALLKKLNPFVSRLYQFIRNHWVETWSSIKFLLQRNS